MTKKLRSRESIILSGPEYEVRAPAYPAKAEYIRIVRTSDGEEQVYWDSAEWQDDPNLECFGAILGVLKQVAGGEDLTISYKILPKDHPSSQAFRLLDAEHPSRREE